MWSITARNSAQDLERKKTGHRTGSRNEGIMAKGLKEAIEANDPAAVAAALKGVKDINRKLPGAAAPLVYACEVGADKILDTLIKAGAVAEKKNMYGGETP